MKRTILHVDLDAFFCSVEELRDTELIGKPFVVGGSAEGRGVISSASYAAREYGIRSAMPTARALNLCRDLIVLPARHRIYSEHSRKVMSLLRDSAPVVEQISIDEAFLDVSDDPRGGPQVALDLKNEIQDRFKLRTSWGIANNKLVAKIATEVGKPDGLVFVPHGEEAAFLAPLPVGMLWGVGPKTQTRLAEHGVRTIGDLAMMSSSILEGLFGEHGLDLATKAKGIDKRPVTDERETHSMSSERTFERDIADESELSSILLQLCGNVGQRLRAEELAGETVRIKLRWPDFSTLTRQTKLEQPTDQDGEIYQAAMELFKRVWRKGRPVRLLGVGVSDLGPPIRQLALFSQSWEQDGRLLKAIDEIRAKYGSSALLRGGVLKRRYKRKPSSEKKDRN
ncbi:MAG: DNA polymerase IV [Anaerolineaceae bacterium]|nr:MAG: DNA polymerase IV [Anaerolineaceae bacterium]